MKLKYTTKLFVAINIILVTLRTLQIIFLTESTTHFLKPNHTFINTIGTIFAVLCFVALFFNAYSATRQPEKINCRGGLSFAASVILGILFAMTGSIAAAIGSNMLAFTAFLTMAACITLAISCLAKKFLFFNVSVLFFIAYWLAEFLFAYLFYTERPLRVRTVLETFAICFMILFSIIFGKVVCGVKTVKNFRRLYPFGLTASTLCILCFVPELIASLLGYSDKVSDSSAMPFALAAGALFSGFFTINTFKRKNTLHHKHQDH